MSTQLILILSIYFLLSTHVCLRQTFCTSLRWAFNKDSNWLLLSISDDTTTELTAKSHINMCLAHLFKSLDMNKTNEFLKYLLLNKYFTSDTEVKHVLSNLIDFLAWSPYESMDLWCIGFMTLLPLINKYYVIIEISELKIDYVCICFGFFLKFLFF